MLNKISNYAQTHKTEIAIGAGAVALLAVSAVLLTVGIQHLHFSNYSQYYSYGQYLSPKTHLPYEIGMLMAGGVVGGVALFMIVHLVAKKIMRKAEENKAEKLVRLRKVLMIAKVVVIVAGIVMLAVGLSYLLHNIGADHWGYNQNWQWVNLGRSCNIAGVTAALGVIAGGGFLGGYALPSLAKDILTQKNTFNIQLKANPETDL